MLSARLTPRGILLAGVLALYAAFPTRTYYWDGVLFSLNIESVAQGRASPAMLVHPNHLLYSAFGYMLYRAVLTCGLGVRAIAVLQTCNMLASTAAAAVVYAIAKCLTNSARTSLFCMTLFAFGATWWKFSTDADAYIVSILLLLLALYFVVADPPRLLPAACCHTAAMLFHQLAIFTYPAVFAAILLRSRPKNRIRTCFAYLAATGACVTAAYGICYIAVGRSAYASFAKFITSYASDSDFTRSFGQIFRYYLTSYGKLFVGGKVGLAREFLSTISGLAFALCLAAFGYGIARLRHSTARIEIDRRTLIVVWAWLLPGTIFLAIWDPASAFHKLFVWPAIVLLLTAYAASRKPAASIAFAAAIAAWNFGAFIYPHSHAHADPVLEFAQQLDRELPKNATVYYSAFSPDDWYLDYFAPGRTWIKLNGLPQANPYCLDTTALAAARVQNPIERWALVNAQHNIRLECFNRTP